MMDSWEFNKIAAAILAALLVIFGGKEIIVVSQGGHGKQHTEVGYKLPVEIAAAESDDANRKDKKKSGLDFAEIAKLMVDATPKAGAAVFKKCSACHTPTEGGKNGVGPNLWDIINRQIGNIEEFKYSKAMAEKDGNWDYEALANFLHKPKKWLKGTKMAFAGLKGEQDIADVIIYLRSLSNNPATLPDASSAN